MASVFNVLLSLSLSLLLLLLLSLSLSLSLLFCCCCCCCCHGDYEGRSTAQLWLCDHHFTLQVRSSSIARKSLRELVHEFYGLTLAYDEVSSVV